LNGKIMDTIGELLVAVTVVAMLFYMARPLRHATSVARRAARQTISGMNVDTHGPSIDPHVRSRAATKVGEGEELSPGKPGNDVRWILMRMGVVENAHDQYEEEPLDAGESSAG
jgi:hypothetical protein